MPDDNFVTRHLAKMCEPRAAEGDGAAYPRFVDVVGVGRLYHILSYAGWLALQQVPDCSDPPYILTLKKQVGGDPEEDLSVDDWERLDRVLGLHALGSPLGVSVDTWRAQFLPVLDAASGTFGFKLAYYVWDPAEQKRQSRQRFEQEVIQRLENGPTLTETGLAVGLFEGGWLEEREIGRRLAQQPANGSPVAQAHRLQPVQRATAQDETILATLEKLGYNPQALPAPAAGRASVPKQAAKKALGYSTAVMNKAWQRLRNEGRIKDA